MYTVEVTHMQRMVTLYDGKSRDRAADTANCARIALVIGKGSGEVTLRKSGVADVIWSVKDGEAFLALVAGVAGQIAQAEVKTNGPQA